MTKKIKEFTNWLDEMTSSFSEEQRLWELGSKAEPKQEDEEVQYTCCGDEITGEVEDIGLCPTCLEHI